MFQIFLFVGLAQVLNYVHAPFACAVFYALLSAVALFILQVSPPMIGIICGVRWAAAYACYKGLEYVEDNVVLWWVLLVASGIAMYKGEEYLLARIVMSRMFS